MLILSLCWLTLTVSGEQELIQRRLQIPGIFDLSVGGNRPGDNTESNENEAVITNTAPTDPPTYAPTIAPTRTPVAETAAPTIAVTQAATETIRDVDSEESPAANEGISATITRAPSPAPVLSASSTSSGRATNFPTVPIPPKDLPNTVDIVQCRQHLQAVDANRNSLLTETEYVQLVRRMVAAEGANLDAWGNTLQELPPGFQILYANLKPSGVIDVAGAIDIAGANTSGEPTLIQKVFLLKVCVHTEILVHLALNGGDEKAYSVSNVQVESVYSSFQLSNKFGLKSSHLESGTDREGLELAYQTLVTQVVGQKVGQALTPPSRGRRLTISADPQLAEIYQIDDTPCPGQDPARVPMEWCQIAYAKFRLYLVEEPDVYDEYSQAVQDATAQGQLQSLLEQLEPNAAVKVTGAGPTILPPPPTPSPTPALPLGIPAAQDSPQEPPLLIVKEKNDDKHVNQERIFVLAGILVMVYFCVMGVSIYMCWRNRSNTDLDLGIYDDDPTISDAYYDDLRASRASRLRRRKSGVDDSHAPTMDDILEAQEPSHEFNELRTTNSDVYNVTGKSASDAYSVSGRSDEYSVSGKSTKTYSAAPTREEIEATIYSASSRQGNPSVSFAEEYSEYSETEGAWSDPRGR